MTDGGSARARAEELWARAASERQREEEARAAAERLEAQAGAWAAGAEGERRVAGALRSLPDGWIVLHDRLLRPGTSLTNIDHVVVGPGGVFLVDAKNWAGGLSVHDDDLWQHKRRSSAKGAELDKLARFAGEMETALGVPVVPVVALAGAHGSRFRAQRVRGVEVVPHGRLARWLRRQPTTTDSLAAELLSRKIAHTYPPASEDVAAGTPVPTTSLTVPAVVAPHPGTNHRSASRVAKHAGQRQGRRPSVVKAVVGFGLLVALSQLAPHLPQILGSAVPNLALPHGSSPPTTDAKPGKQCQSLGRAVIARVTGAKVVVEQARHDEACAWWLSKPRYANQRADVTVNTGLSVRIALASTASRESRIDMMPGEVTAWLPEGTSLAGWKPGSTATQAFSVSLRFGYPKNATRTSARSTEAAAERTVTRLAEQAAIALAARETTR